MPEAVHLGDLLRIWVRPGARFTPSPPDFQDQRELTGRRRNRDAFQGAGPSLGANPFQGALPFTKKRELSPGLPPASPGSFALPHWTPRGAYLRHSRFGDLNPTPFRSAGGDVGHRPPFRTAFAHLLGPTDPCSTAVHMEPFSTSAFQSSRLNICYYHQDLHPRRLHPGPRPRLPCSPRRPSYSSRRSPRGSCRRRRPGMGRRSSAIHFQG
ncbi:hypothetical protein PAMP_025202 [Pampus punctatissimus]